MKMGETRCCKYCNSKDIEYSEVRGDSICCQCGAVLEENAMVEGLQFMESSAGAVTMVGQFIPTTGGNRGFTAMYSRESRELVLQRGYNNIQWIADRLRLSNQLVESAQRVYLMAVQRNFTMGRNNFFVASACLYTICRRERTPHMLIDFSDVVQASVRALGQVFMKLLRLLHFQIPHIDPSLFMERFASQMSLGDKVTQVAFTGVRLIQAMTRDWICTGRRPTGLCGSALLIAARYHGFRINAEDIASVVRIGSPTLLRRLSEFQHTSAAQLSIQEFEHTDLMSLPVLCGPPCYEKRKTKAAMMAIKNEEADEFVYKRGNRDGSAASEADSSVECVDSNLLRIGGPPEIDISVSHEDLCNDNPTSDDITRIAGYMIDAVDAAVSRLYGDSEVMRTTETTTHQTEATDGSVVTPTFEGENSTVEGDVEAVKYDSLAVLLKSVQKVGNELIPERHGGRGECQTNKMIAETNDIYDYNREDTTEREAIEFRDVNEYADEATDVIVESLSDVDDSEVADMLLSEREKRVKAVIWDQVTKDIMPEVYRRIRARKNREIESEMETINKRKVPRVKKGQALPAATSAADSVRIALQRSGKGIINRMNDDVLAALFPGPVSTFNA